MQRLIDVSRNLYEQQSTFNPNMPIRALMYLGRQYDKFIELNDIKLYSSKLQKLPAPRCVMFYNGDAKAPARDTLKLTDAFGEKSDSSSVEVIVDVYNINYGENQELLDRCVALHDYSLFVGAVKAGRRQGMPLGAAVDEAMKMAAKKRLLGGYFAGHRAEVKSMVLTEYDEDKVMYGFYEDGQEDMAERVARKMKNDGVSKEIISKYTNLTMKAIDELEELDPEKFSYSIRKEYDDQGMNRRFYEDGIEKGIRKKGLEIGREAGRREANVETARKFKAEGIDINVISKCTGLPIKEVEAL